jgi:predicted permease
MPTIASLAGILCVWCGFNASIPTVAVDSVRMVGACTIPLALMVVGADLARIKIAQVDKKNMILVCLIKLVVMPLAGLAIAKLLRLPQLIGLLLVMQLAVPSATSLSAVLRHCKKEDLLVSQGILFTHIVSILTLPLFLSIYLMMSGAR